MSNTKHTQGKADIFTKTDLSFPYPRYIRVNSMIICVAEGGTSEISQANAERICTAWNNYDEMKKSVAELTKLLEQYIRYSAAVDGSTKEERDKLVNEDCRIIKYRKLLSNS